MSAHIGEENSDAGSIFYNCGTSHNRQNLDETVADLARRTAGSENRDWMINDGPGSFSHHVGKGASPLPPGASPDKPIRPVRATRLQASSKTRGSRFPAA